MSCQARPTCVQEGNAAESRGNAFLKYLGGDNDSVRLYSEVKGRFEPLLTWKKDALQPRGRCGGRGLPLILFPPLSSSSNRSKTSSRSTILTADTNGMGFCRASARALLTTAHISLPEVTSSQQMTKLASQVATHQKKKWWSPQKTQENWLSIVKLVIPTVMHTEHFRAYFDFFFSLSISI